MKIGVLVFCIGDADNSVKVLKQELKGFEIISLKYKPDASLTKKQAEVEEAKARNRALLELAHFDYLIILDSNEFIFREDAAIIKRHLEQNKPSLLLANRKLYAAPDKTYVDDTHTPVIALNPREAQFYLKRCARGGGGAFLNKVTVHDFSLLGKTVSEKTVSVADVSILEIIQSCSFKENNEAKKTIRKKSVVKKDKEKKVIKKIRN